MATTAKKQQVCPNKKCGGTNFENWDSVLSCVSCGTVVEDNTIVSEVTFADTEGGGSAVVGQFVPESGKKKNLPGYQKQSREVTLMNGKRKIQQIASALKLKGHHVESADRFFKLAVQHNFVQGRRTQNVVAACLYIVCRRLKTPHMLIDFSDLLQTNVYVLGHTYLKLCRVLNIQPPIIDPSLYIHRFAAQLEFGDQEQEVANTALRLVQRMKRDWIQTGRRPAGICGAGLLIAARLHGFRRTQREIIQVVRICDVTLRKRLFEFGETPSCDLTPAEFETMDLDTECDPPAFKRAREKEKEEESIRQGKRPKKEKKKGKKDESDEDDEESEENVKEEDEDEEEDDGKKKGRRKRKAKTQKQSATKKKRKTGKNSAKNIKEEDKEDEEKENNDSAEKKSDPEEDLDENLVESEMKAVLDEGEFDDIDPTKLAVPMMPTMKVSEDAEQPAEQAAPPKAEVASTVNKIIEEQQAQQEEKEREDDNFSDINDDELDMYLASEAEVKVKTIIWSQLNKDFLEAEAEKERERQEAIAAGKVPPSEKRRKKNEENKNKQKQQNIHGATGQPLTTGQAVASAVLRKVPEKSAKINYSAIEKLFDSTNDITKNDEDEEDDLNGSTDTFNASKNYPSELTLDSSTTSLPRSQFATPVLTHGPFARLGLNNRSSGIMSTSLNNNNKRDSLASSQALDDTDVDIRKQLGYDDEEFDDYDD
jgi:transcription factor IIIB subunit 2